MADYRLSAQTISRGKGQCAVTSAVYRSASRLINERTGDIYDYRCIFIGPIKTAISAIIMRILF